VFSFAVTAACKCRRLYSARRPTALCRSRHAEPCRRGSQSAAAAAALNSAFRTTVYSAVTHADAAPAAAVDVFQTAVPYRHHPLGEDKAALSVGWVDPWVGLGWIGSSCFEIFLVFGGSSWVHYSKKYYKKLKGLC